MSEVVQSPDPFIAYAVCGECKSPVTIIRPSLALMEIKLATIPQPRVVPLSIYLSGFQLFFLSTNSPKFDREAKLEIEKILTDTFDKSSVFSKAPNGDSQ